MLVAAAPALAMRPFGVAAVRPMLQCGEHGPTRLSELRSWLAQDSNRGHVLVPECGAQWALHGPLCVRRGTLQSVAPHGGALERALLDVELRDVAVRPVAQPRERDPSAAVRDRDGGPLVATLRTEDSEVGVEGMGCPARVMGGLAQQSAQLA